MQGKGLGETISFVQSCDICLVGASIRCSSRVSDVSRLEVSGTSHTGGGSGGRGGFFLSGVAAAEESSIKGAETW